MGDPLLSYLGSHEVQYVRTIQPPRSTYVRTLGQVRTKGHPYTNPPPLKYREPFLHNAVLPTWAALLLSIQCLYNSAPAYEVIA